MTNVYERPKNLQQALELFNNNFTPIYSYYSMDSLENGNCLMDMQDCGLDQIKLSGNDLSVGATAKLSDVLDHPECPSALKTAIKLEEQENRRNMISLLECAIKADGNSPVATVLSALDAHLVAASDNTKIPLSDQLLTKGRGLFSAIIIPIDVITSFQTIKSTPADRPLVSAALTKWTTGRVRLVLGGTGHTPTLVVDGKGADGIEKAAESAYVDAGDFKASKEYRSEMAKLLTTRCIAEINNVF